MMKMTEVKENMIEMVMMIETNEIILENNTSELLFSYQICYDKIYNEY